MEELHDRHGHPREMTGVVDLVTEARDLALVVREYDAERERATEDEALSQMATTRVPLVVRTLASSLVVLAVVGLWADPAQASIPLTPRPRGPDFNGDGYADLAIGGREHYIGPGPELFGKVDVLWGGPAGLGAAPSSSVAILETDLPGVVSVWEFADSLVWGDFDGDCYDDLVVGDRRETPDTTLGFYGTLYAFYGSAAGLSPADMVQIDRDTPGMEGESGAIAFAFSLAVGDFDGDLIDDLAIGVPGDTIDGEDSAGSVQIVYGSPEGFVPRTGLRQQILHRNVRGMQGPANQWEDFGRVLAAGDFDCDGYEDLAAAFGYSAVSSWGVQVVYGSASGLDPAAGPGNQVWDALSLGVDQLAGIHPQAMTAGNFDGNLGSDSRGYYIWDACMDLVLGFPFEEFESEFSGEVVVVYGTPYDASVSGLQTSFIAPDVFDLSTPGIPGEPEEVNAFGSAFTIGRFDAVQYDDTDDLAVVTEGGAILIGGGASGLSAFGSLEVPVTIDGTTLAGSGNRAGYGAFDGWPRHLVITRPEDWDYTGYFHVVHLENTESFSVDSTEVWTADDLPGQFAAPHEGLGTSATAGRSTLRATCGGW